MREWNRSGTAAAFASLGANLRAVHRIYLSLIARHFTA
jgi:hypothetical protein